ncbi:MAG: hypothetical protein ACI8UO_003870 [Verrucomicrobiales bacterium]|jgi:hypothetical protein
MAEPSLRASFTRRRVVGGSLVLAGLLVGLVALWFGQAAFIATSFYSGFALLGLILLLTLFNARKKIPLPFLPILSASAWLQFHIYAGFLSVILFLIHVEFRIPTGLLEGILTVVFAIVTLSGIFGLFVSRLLPKRMRRSGEALVYERTPRHRREIRENVHELVLKAEETCESSTIPDFYVQHVEPFLSRPASWRLPFMSRERGSPTELYHELEARGRYLSDDEKELAAELREWVETKENLDFQESSMRLLKIWLFVHIPFTYSLILLGIAHAVIVLLYGGNG